MANDFRTELADLPFPSELVEFTPYPENPVFEARGPGHWDAKIRERGWILREEGVYHLWYTGYEEGRSETKKLGYATSKTGLADWARHPEPIFSSHWVEDMMVVKRGRTYYMFAEGSGDRAHLLTSSDRIHWTRQGRLDIRYVDGDPLSPGPYGTPTAWWENGTWYLFYERRDEGIWLATSQDMKVWTHVLDDPVLVPGPAKYDGNLIALNQIVKHRDLYYAYYHGRGSDPFWSTNVAVSMDLIHWRKYPGNPLLPAEENRSSGILVHDGKQFRLYTMHDRVDVFFEAHS